MNKEELNRCLAEEKKLYLGEDAHRAAAMRKSRHKRFRIWQYLVCFRKCRYYAALRVDGTAGALRRRLAKYRFRYYNKKKNRFGERAGIEIGLESHIGARVDIWHGGVVINGTLGEDCVIHGNVVIGNKGKGRETETPVIGSGADIGAGAVIIGSVKIAERCVIGAGAVVTRSFETPGSVLAGVPAKMIKAAKGNET